jgi:translation initiation factor IF-1
MWASEQIEGRGTIVEVLGPSAYRAELANGHRCIARSGVKESTIYALGEGVMLAFHPADLSRARIVAARLISPAQEN